MFMFISLTDSSAFGLIVGAFGYVAWGALPRGGFSMPFNGTSQRKPALCKCLKQLRIYSQILLTSYLPQVIRSLS